jgi:hypothetical protein
MKKERVLQTATLSPDKKLDQQSYFLSGASVTIIKLSLSS